MSGASRLTRCTALSVGIGHYLCVAVILIPCIFAPADFIGQDGMLILNGSSVFLAEFLTELDRTRRTDFNTLAAGNAFFTVNF